MAPVIHALADHDGVSVDVCVSGQHREMLDSVLDLFNISPMSDLDVMLPGQDLSGLTARILERFTSVLSKTCPHLVVVHGDTSTTMAASLAAFYKQVPIAHVEAGLRTFDKASPFPEEINRRLVTALADIHFAPTVSAKDNLLREGVEAGRIHITGNTVVDALQLTIRKLSEPACRMQAEQDLFELAPNLRRAMGQLSTRRLLLVTAHRRENAGQGIRNICLALRKLAADLPIEIVFPVHLNPTTSGPVNELLEGVSNIHLTPPIPYLPFVLLLKSATAVITDSGGIQEEASAIGVPAIVARMNTERAEGVVTNNIRLVGTGVNDIIAATRRALIEQDFGCGAVAATVFGDGKAGVRIAQAIFDAMASGELATTKSVQGASALTPPQVG